MKGTLLKHGLHFKAAFTDLLKRFVDTFARGLKLFFLNNKVLIFLQLNFGTKLDNWQFRIVRQGTPGTYTFLLPATREVPRRLQHPKRSTIGVRVPSHALVQALLAELGEPILSSTLILPGASEPLNDAETIRDALGSVLDLVIDAGACPAAPTTVVDLALDPPVIVRLGAGELARLGLDLPRSD